MYYLTVGTLSCISSLFSAISGKITLCGCIALHALHTDGSGVYVPSVSDIDLDDMMSSSFKGVRR